MSIAAASYLRWPTMPAGKYLSLSWTPQRVHKIWLVSITGKNSWEVDARDAADRLARRWDPEQRKASRQMGLEALSTSFPSARMKATWSTTAQLDHVSLSATFHPSGEMLWQMKSATRMTTLPRLWTLLTSEKLSSEPTSRRICLFWFSSIGPGHGLSARGGAGGENFEAVPLAART